MSEERGGEHGISNQRNDANRGYQADHRRYNRREAEEGRKRRDDGPRIQTFDEDEFSASIAGHGFGYGRDDEFYEQGYEGAFSQLRYGSPQFDDRSERGARQRYQECRRSPGSPEGSQKSERELGEFGVDQDYDDPADNPTRSRAAGNRRVNASALDDDASDRRRRWRRRDGLEFDQRFERGNRYGSRHERSVWHGGMSESGLDDRYARYQRGDEASNNSDQRGVYPHHQQTQSQSGKGPRGYKRQDARIEEDVCERLTAHDEIDASGINVGVGQGEVTLTGEVNHRYEKHLAEDIAASVRGVSDVHNRLRVRGRLSSGLFGGGEPREELAARYQGGGQGSSQPDKDADKAVEPSRV